MASLARPTRQRARARRLRRRLRLVALRLLVEDRICLFGPGISPESKSKRESTWSATNRFDRRKRR